MLNGLLPAENCHFRHKKTTVDQGESQAALDSWCNESKWNIHFAYDYVL